MLAGCLGPSLSQAKPAELKEIRIAVPDVSASNRSTGAGVTVVLENQHLLEKAFADDGIAIKWLYFKGVGPAINEAYANGQVDFAYIGDLAAIIGKSGGLDTRLLSATTRGIPGYLAVVPGSAIHRLADLKGKRVGVSKGTSNHLSFDSALASQGLTEKDIQLINLDAHAASAALSARQLDAIWGPSTLLALQKSGSADIAVDSSHFPDGAGQFQGVLVARGGFVDDYPEVTQRFLQVQRKAFEWLRSGEHDEEYSQIFTELSGYPRTFDPLNGLDFKTTFNPDLDADFLQRLQASVDLAYRLKLIRRTFSVQEWAVAQ
ncbi:ABC transporter substrate-binding protein [Pseudomonas sp. C2L12B]|uniref:ABC transporter substrate-binding protein n=1 Tax=Pseudomonas typographi TaxID=2715964 RepID=A0ABR7Z2C4_9PSED|nr:ABC transporter substrate-binding protein [Pseudomonas typographi]MBD1587252.1 ABC transporter substrate-binding protein [Pseudomonas typographi]MBD1599567.1 ABC transporter substrate-binding protein [Pseudomonas typographi]